MTYRTYIEGSNNFIISYGQHSTCTVVMKNSHGNANVTLITSYAS